RPSSRWHRPRSLACFLLEKCLLSPAPTRERYGCEFCSPQIAISNPGGHGSQDSLKEGNVWQRRFPKEPVELLDGINAQPAGRQALRPAVFSRCVGSSAIRWRSPEGFHQALPRGQGRGASKLPEPPTEPRRLLDKVLVTWLARGPDEQVEHLPPDRHRVVGVFQLQQFKDIGGKGGRGLLVVGNTGLPGQPECLQGQETLLISRVDELRLLVDGQQQGGMPIDLAGNRAGGFPEAVWVCETLESRFPDGLRRVAS